MRIKIKDKDLDLLRTLIEAENNDHKVHLEIKNRKLFAVKVFREKHREED